MSAAAVIRGLVSLLALTWCVASRLSYSEDTKTPGDVLVDSTTGLHALEEGKKALDDERIEDLSLRKQYSESVISATTTRKGVIELGKEQEEKISNNYVPKREVKGNMTSSINTYSDVDTLISEESISPIAEGKNKPGVEFKNEDSKSNSTETMVSSQSYSTNTKIKSFEESSTVQVGEANITSTELPTTTQHNNGSGVQRPFDLYDRNLPCAKADNLTRPARTSHCEFEWTEGAELPLVRCELVATLDKFGGHLYNSGWFSARCDERTDSGRLCLRPIGYTIRRREALGELGSSVLPTDPLIQVLSSQKARSLLTVVTSHGFRESQLRLRPDAIGPRGLLNEEPCRNCTPDVWIFQYKYDAEVIRLYMNRGFSLRLEFEPAFVRLATVWLTLLEEDAFMEELEIHGGERWDEIGETALLPKLPRLRKVDLARNGLQNIATDNFRNNRQIQHLGLANNNFSTIPEGISLLFDLRFLDLSGNPLTVVSYVEAFRPLDQLRILNLSHVALGGLEALDDVTQDDTTFNSSQLLPRLTLLDLSACGVSDLNTTAVRRVLRHRPTLRSLSLSYNPLHAPPPPTLVANLPALRELRLAGCGLRQPPALRLASNTRLRVLDLANNFLETPEGVIAQGNKGTGVDLLDLSGNPLRRGWGSHAFMELGPNVTVNISHTTITAFSIEMLEALRPLKQVDLGGNQIDCGHCATANLREWLLETGGPQVLVLGEQIPVHCTQSSNYAGLAVTAAKFVDDACHQTVDADGKGLVGTTGHGTTNGGVNVWLVAGIASVACVGAFLALALLAFRFRLELTYAIHVIRANYWISSKSGSTEADAHEFDAFVCYSKFDRAWVLGELLPRLEGSSPRYRLCLHERDFPLGSLIVQNIVECMARSRRTLIILTKTFVQSQWCQWELEMATHRLLEGAKDFLVLVELERLEPRELPRLLRLLVETRTFLQWPTEVDVATARKGTGGASDVSSIAESDPIEIAWQRLRSALGPPLRPNRRSSRYRHRIATVPPLPLNVVHVDSKDGAACQPQRSDITKT